MTVDGSPATHVRLEYQNSHVALVTLDHPPANTLSWESRRALISILDELDADPEVRCLVITGAGRRFTAGANLREDQAMTDDQIEAFLGDFDRILTGIEGFRAPVIAAINGATIGGGLEFAMACDIRIASTDAFFVAAGVNVGLIANFWRLARITGLGPAKEILLTGDRYTAEQALTWGLVTEVHAPDAVLPAALAKAERIATRAPLSVEATKRCANVALDLQREPARALQVENFMAMFRTEDHKEALAAFFDKRLGDYRRR